MSGAAWIRETNFYTSIEAAIACHQERGDNPWATVKAKIASGAIAIGEPEVAAGEKLVLMDHRQRYGIMRGVRERVDGL
jgi:hypothetical protein